MADLPGQPPKRRKVSKACDRCRRRKDKCDGKAPVCSTCRAAHEVCSYDSSTKKRGLPDGYVRGLERLCGAMIYHVPRLQEVMLAKLQGTAEAKRAFWSHGGSVESLDEVWKNSRLAGELEALLPDLDAYSKRDKKRRRSDGAYAAPSFGGNAAAELGIPGDTGDASSNQVLYASGQEPGKLSGAAGLITLAAPSPHPSVSSTVDVGALTGVEDEPISAADWPLPSDASRLVEIYFSYTHAWLPLLERHDLLRLLHQDRRLSDCRRSSKATADYAALWALFAVSCIQRSLTSAESDDRSDHADLQCAALFYRRSRELIPEETGKFELGHAQALLLMAVFRMAHGQYEIAWLLVGRAVRLAITIGLHESTGNVAGGRAQHVLLGCFVLDTMVSCRLDRIPHLRADDSCTMLSIGEDGLEEWESWSDGLQVTVSESAHPSDPLLTLSTFNSLVRSTRLLNEAICGDLRGADLQLRGRNLLAKAQMWWEDQPVCPQVDGNGAAQQGFVHLPHHFDLRFAHLNTVVATHRRVLRMKEAGFPTSVSLESQLLLVKLSIEVLTGYVHFFRYRIISPVFDCFVKAISDYMHGVETGRNPELIGMIQRLKDLLYTIHSQRLVPASTAMIMGTPASNHHGEHQPAHAYLHSRPAPPADDRADYAPTYDVASLALSRSPHELANQQDLHLSQRPPYIGDSHHQLVNDPSPHTHSLPIQAARPASLPLQTWVRPPPNSNTTTLDPAAFTHIGHFGQTSHPSRQLTSLDHRPRDSAADESLVDLNPDMIDGDSIFNEFAAMDAGIW